MIIRVIGSDADELGAAQKSLDALVRDWGHDLSAAATLAPLVTHDDESRVVDPIELSALILSVPSAILAVADLADRIQKRRRAHDLITRAQELGAQGITVQIITQGHPTELATLDPDQLLDLTIQEEDNPPAD